MNPINFTSHILHVSHHFAFESKRAITTIIPSPKEFDLHLSNINQIYLTNVFNRWCLLLPQWSINYFKGEHAQTQFWSNFEITKCCGYREYKVKVIKIYLTLFFLCQNVNFENGGTTIQIGILHVLINICQYLYYMTRLAISRCKKTKSQHFIFWRKVIKCWWPVRTFG